MIPNELKHILKAEIDPAFRARAQLILNTVGRLKPKRVLDAGCGRGFYLHALTYFPFIREIHGVDLNQKYLDAANRSIRDRRVKIQKGSIYKPPYPHEYFDAIICSEVLEHLTNDTKALEELKRVLKPGGSLIISVPNYHFPFLWDPLNWILMRLFDIHVPKHIWWLAGIWADHERLYEKSQLQEILEKSGFKVEKSGLLIRWCWPFSHFLLYGIGKNLVEKCGAKEFDRFDFKEKPLASLFAFIVRVPTFIQSKSSTHTSVNILMTVTKS